MSPAFPPNILTTSVAYHLEITERTQRLSSFNSASKSYSFIPPKQTRNQIKQSNEIAVTYQRANVHTQTHTQTDTSTLGFTDSECAGAGMTPAQPLFHPRRPGRDI